MPVQSAPQLPARLLRNCVLLPDRLDVLPLVPKGGTFVEVGVALGDFSAHVLSLCDVAAFVAIDLFTLHDMPGMWGGEVGRRLGGLRHEEFYRHRFAGDARVRTMAGDSRAQLARLPDGSVDVIYLDAEHSYASVKAELEEARRKVRPGGWIWFNDYTHHDPYSGETYGVPRAAHEFMIAEGWEAVFLTLQPDGFYDLVTRKAA